MRTGCSGGRSSHRLAEITFGLRPNRIAMRPNTSSKIPHTMTDVVDEPVAGIDPIEPLYGVPPVDARVVGVAPTIVNVVVRVPLVAPVEVTV